MIDAPERSSVSPLRGSDARARRFSTAIGAVMLALLLVAFFWTPLSRYSSVHYSSADLTQDFSLTNVEPGHRVHNRLLSDPVVQMQPWLAFNQAELASGRVPLWNPYNGCGAPQLANYQSAVFSPFSAPFYLFDARAALLLSAALKLFALGVFTLLFLRALGLDLGPSLIGAAAFTFAGHNVLLLAYPHPAAAIALPAGLYFVERACQAFDAAVKSSAQHPARAAFGWLAGLAIAFAAAVLAGHPEPLFFGVAVVALYTVFRLAMLRRELGANSARHVAAFGTRILIAAMLAAGLSAFQTLPFLEYLRNSTILAQRLLGAAGLPLSNWPLWFFPNALGNPTLRYNLADKVPEPNFEAANTVYIGALALFGALLALRFAKRDARLVFFLALAAAWFLCVYDVLGAQTLFNLIPGSSLAPLNRSQIVWLLALSVGLAFAIQHLQPSADARNARRALVIGALALAALLTALLAADALVSRTITERALEPRDYATYVPRHFLFIGATFGTGALALALLAVLRGARMRSVAFSVVLAVVFLQSGFLLADYNPCVDDADYFPETPALNELRSRVGTSRLLVLGEDTLPPDSNVAYRVAMTTSYDTLWVRRYDRLFQIAFESAENWRDTLVASEHILGLFGVEYVLAYGDWLPIDSDPAWSPAEGRPALAPLHLAVGREVVQSFTCARDGLQAVAVWLGAVAHQPPSELRVRVESAQSGEVLSERTLQSHAFLGEFNGPTRNVFATDLRLDSPGKAVVLRFPAVAHSQDSEFRLRLTAIDGVPEQGWRAWIVGEPERVDRHLAQGDAPLAGRLLFDTSTSLDRFEPVCRLGWFQLWRYAKSSGRYWLVHGVRRADGEEAALGRTLARDWDPAESVVLENVPLDVIAPSDATRGEPRPEVLEETPTRVRLRVRAAKPGHLVIADAFYPGWRATVDGAPVPLLCANYAFNAIAVTVGEHEVVFEYTPSSFQIGAWIAAASAAIGGALILRAILARRRELRRSVA